MGYTPFAIFASLTILTLAFSGIGVEIQGQVTHDLPHSTERSVEATQAVYTQDSISELAEISKTEDIQSFKQSVKNLTLRGKFRGSEEKESDLSRLSSNIAQLLGKVDKTEIKNFSFNLQNFSLSTSTEARLILEDKNFSLKSEETSKVSNVTDPLLDSAGFSRRVQTCSYQSLIKEIEGASTSSGTARGKPLNASDISPSSDRDKVVYSSDITRFNNDTISNFAGYLSTATPSNPSNYNDNYAVGLEIPEFALGQRIIIHQGAWKSNVNRTISNECYLDTPNIPTPSIGERIENKSIGETAQGVFSLLNVQGDSSKSNVVYERISGSGDLVELEGINRGDGESSSSFRINRSLAESEDLQPLIY